MNVMRTRLIAVAVGSALAAGCAGPAAPASNTIPATSRSAVLEDNPASTQPSFWLDQPGDTQAQVVGEDFQKLWSACEEVLQGAHFRIDRSDFRRGMLSSVPMLSRQFFELWRSDGVTIGDVAESSLAKTRRTIYFTLERDEAGRTFTATPKVLVERFASVEPKLRGTIDYAPTYWYAIRRDTAMEKVLAERLRRQLQRGGR